MASLTIPLFPLGTVLFPGGLLPLKLFEQRYLEMAKTCLRDASNFGVCGIKQGVEVGDPATPFDIGCVAKVIHWDMPQLGILQIVAQGDERFRLLNYRSQSDNLLIGEVELIANDQPQTIDPAFNDCVEVLKKVIAGVGEQHFPTPLQFDDGPWVSNRLAEILPLPLPTKQHLLQLPNASARLAELSEILHSQGLVA